MMNSWHRIQDIPRSEKKILRKYLILKFLLIRKKQAIYLVASKNNKRVFITGHSEYDPLTLKSEYDRDVSKGLDIKIPKNYYLNDDPKSMPMVKWRSHANLLFSNWLNYCVYQVTPYILENGRK